MIKNKQNKDDFRNYVESVKGEYERKEKNYGWTYKVLFEEIDNVECCFFTNKFETTKILYISSAKIISTTVIYSKDLEIISKLKEGLL